MNRDRVGNHLVEAMDDVGRRLYLRKKSRYGRWTWYRPLAIRFGSREKAAAALKRVRKPGFVVHVTENMDFHAVPPAPRTRIRKSLMDRAERQDEERRAAQNTG
jgi:hypothetical protein